MKHVYLTRDLLYNGSEPSGLKGVNMNFSPNVKVGNQYHISDYSGHSISGIESHRKCQWRRKAFQSGGGVLGEKSCGGQHTKMKEWAALRASGKLEGVGPKGTLND